MIYLRNFLTIKFGNSVHVYICHRRLAQFMKDCSLIFYLALNSPAQRHNTPEYHMLGTEMAPGNHLHALQVCKVIQLTFFSETEHLRWL